MKKTLTAFALAAAFAVPAAAQQPAAPAVKNLKFQSTWPASLTLQDNFKMFAERVDKLTGGQIKIEAAAAGQYVPAFEILDATHKKVIDGGHGVAYYWVGKNKAATLFSATPAGPFGMDHFDFLGWMNEGGGMDLYWEFYRDILKLNIVAWPIGGASPQAFGWFKRPIKSLAERQRLFNLPRSAWSDYDGKLIAKGGGVFERAVQQAGEALEPLLEIVGLDVERGNQRIEAGAPFVDRLIAAAVALVDHIDSLNQHAALRLELRGKLREILERARGFAMERGDMRTDPVGGRPAALGHIVHVGDELGQLARE